MTNSQQRRSGSRVLGLFVEKDQLWGCFISATLFGTKRKRLVQKPIQGDLVGSCQQLLSELGISPEDGVAVGIPTQDCYFVSRAASNAATNVAAKTLLRESLRCNAHSLSNLATDVMHWQPDQRPAVSIVACRDDAVEPFRKACAEQNANLQRVEPAGSALVRAASILDTETRSSECVIRIIVGEHTMLTSICVGKHAVAWQNSPMPTGDEAVGMLTAIRSIQSLRETSGLRCRIGKVIVHGRPELQRLVELEWLQGQAEIPVRWLSGPQTDAGETAEAIAESLFDPSMAYFDLVRNEHSPQRLTKIFPYRQAVLYAGILLTVFFWLWGATAAVEEEHRSLLKSVDPEVAQGKNPQSEKAQLEGRATAFNQFADGRIVWSRLFREIAEGLPPSIRLTSMRGESPLAAGGKTKSGASRQLLVIQGTVPVDFQGVISPDLDQWVAQLRTVPSIKAAFERVELADVQKVTNEQESSPSASFNIQCLPKAAKKPKKDSP
jgi:hypothetical protein